MCGMSNEVSQLFDWDQTRNQPADCWVRAELTHAVGTDRIHGPHPPAGDMSHSAVQSGMHPNFEHFSMAYMKKSMVATAT